MRINPYKMTTFQKFTHTDKDINLTKFKGKDELTPEQEYRRDQLVKDFQNAKTPKDVHDARAALEEFDREVSSN